MPLFCKCLFDRAGDLQVPCFYTSAHRDFLMCGTFVLEKSSFKYTTCKRLIKATQLKTYLVKIDYPPKAASLS